MAEDQQEQSEKTEEPTSRRLQEALKKGQVPNSREVNNFLMLLAFALVIIWLIPSTSHSFIRGFIPYIESSHLLEVSEANASRLLADIMTHFARTAVPIILVAMVVAVVAGTSQHSPILSIESIMPKLEKISPLKGLKRLFSLRSLVEFLKGLLKICLVGLVAFIVLWPMRDQWDSFIGFSIVGIMQVFHSITVKILIGVLCFMIVIAILDYMYQRFEHIKGLRMSRKDIREEMKQSEGDPHVKARLKQIRLERARKRMMAAVPKADVVITNPTHFSIALSYDHGKMAAPVVVAKGIDSLALRIREVAKEHDIPLVENPPLARALYDATEVDEEIPLEFYQAVAEIIGYVYRLKGKKAA